MTLGFALRALLVVFLVAFYGGLAGLVGIAFGPLPLVFAGCTFALYWLIDGVVRSLERRRQRPLERPEALYAPPGEGPRDLRGAR